jgi:hypothetical protein
MYSLYCVIQSIFESTIVCFPKDGDKIAARLQVTPHRYIGLGATFIPILGALSPFDTCTACNV